MRRVLHDTVAVAVPAIPLVAILMVATMAHAQPATPDLFGRPTKPAALKEMRTGNTLYKQGEFERAIDFYKSGQLIQDSPLFLFNLGQCYRQLGDYEQAIWFYERWLSAFNPPADNPARQAVEKWIPQMRAELEQKARSEPPLEAAPDAGQPTSDEGAGEGTGEEESDGRGTEPDALWVTTEPWYRDGLGWGLVGGGVAALAVGGGMLGSASSKDSEANDALSEKRRDALRNEADTRRVVGYVFGGLGAALAIGGVVSFAIPSTSKEHKERRAWIRIGPNGLAVGGRF